MFVIETGEIYVGRFLEPCRRKAILAHEFVHYLQVVTRGTVDNEPGAERLHWAREVEAQSLESLFMQHFCTAESISFSGSVRDR